jgi:hypothetical protein
LILDSQDKTPSELQDALAKVRELTALPIDALTFVLGGMIALIAFVIISKKVRDWYVNKIISSTLGQQQIHWKNHARITFQRHLELLLKELRNSASAVYHRHSEDVFSWDDA